MICGNDILSCGNDLLTCGNDIVSCGNDLLTRGNKIKNDNGIVLCPFLGSKEYSQKRCGKYGTRYNHPDKKFLEVPQYYPSVHECKKHFRHLSDDCFGTTLACFRKKLKSYLFDKAFPP